MKNSLATVEVSVDVMWQLVLIRLALYIYITFGKGSLSMSSIAKKIRANLIKSIIDSVKDIFKQLVRSFEILNIQQQWSQSSLFSFIVNRFIWLLAATVKKEGR